MTGSQSLADEFGIKLEAQVEADAPIFLVEDQQDLRLIVAHHLAKLGFNQIKQFNNGHDVLDFMKANPDIHPSIIICDKDMPVLGGYDFLLEIKENPALTRSAFAITLTQPSREEIMLASENGVDGILVKPYTLKDIVPKLRHAHKVFNNPGNPELVYELAKQEFRNKNWDRAEFIYKRLAEEADKAARPLVGLARVASEKGDQEAALRYLAEAEARNTYYVHTYVERGRLFLKQDRVPEALTQFQRGIELSPLNPVRYEEAAELLFRLQKFQEAADLLGIAITKQLIFPSLHHYASQAFFSLKDYKKAIRHVRAALAVDAENIVYLNQLGVCYKEAELYDDANKVYNAIIKMDPDNRAALYNKSIMLAAKGQFDEAIKLLNRCIEKHPDFDQGVRKLSEIVEKSKQKAG